MRLKTTTQGTQSKKRMVELERCLGVGDLSPSWGQF